MTRQKKGSEFSMVLTVVVIAVVGIFITMFFSSNLLGKASDTGALLKLHTESTEVPLSIDGALTDFTIDADVTLEKDNSLVRVVLVDDTGVEYLVYEAYPIKAEKDKFSITGECEETCALPGIKAASLKITLIDASIKLKSQSFKAEKGLDNNAKVSLALKSEKIRAEKRNNNINIINQNIEENGLSWTAGETSVSQMSFQEKKKMFIADENGNQEVPNLQGFEYYKGGIFPIATEDSSNSITGNIFCRQADGCQTTDPTVPKSQYPLFRGWDWRAAHGENWMSPVKNQGACGSCWDFGAVGTVEGTINAYFNQHINADLSEQHVICKADGDCTGGMAADALGFIKGYGVSDEQCLRYATANEPCTLCSGSTSRLWKITGYGDVSLTDVAIKKALKEKGPLSFSFPDWQHSMMIVGYDKLNTGTTIWILRNSWGTQWGEDGYARIMIPVSYWARVHYVDKPYFAPNPSSYVQKCVDKDLDGYCNWGLGPKPSTCPTTCKSTIDCDDSNKNILNCTYDAYGSVNVPLKYPWSYTCEVTYARAWPLCTTKGGVEICDAVDDDADGLVDEGCDDDLDTYWDSTMLCKGYYLAGNGVAYECRDKWTDLNDTNPKIGSEKCNNIDDDKLEGGKIDEGCDDDKDGYWDKDMICEGSFLSGIGVFPCLNRKDLDDTNPNIRNV